MAKEYTVVTEEIMNEIREGNIELRNKIVMEHVGIIKTIVQRYYNSSIVVAPHYTGYEFEDLLNDRIIKILNVIHKFDPSRATIVTFISYVTTTDMLMFYRASKVRFKFRNSHTSLQTEVVNVKDGSSTFLEDLLSDDQHIIAYDDVAIKYQLEKNNNLFTDTEIKIIKLLALDYTQKEIGAELGFSQSYVSRLVRKCKSKLIEIGAVE